MSQLSSILKPSIIAMSPYAWEDTTEQIAEKYNLKPENVMRLDFNTPLNSPECYDEFLKVINEKRDVNIYSDFSYEILKKLIAEYDDVEPNEVACGNSGDEIIDIIGKSCLNPGDTFIVSSPCYSMFRIQCEINGGKAINVPLESALATGRDLSLHVPLRKFIINVQKIIDTANAKNAKIIWICNPNNPTGNMVARSEEIEKILEKCPNALVVIDEAYIEFYDKKKSMSTYIKKYPNLIITRTFSKFGKIAAARIGYALTNSFLADKLNVLRFPMGISYFSMEIAKVVLSPQNKPFIKKYIEEVKNYRPKFIKELKKLGFEVFDSVTNFVLFRYPDASPEKCDKLFEYLKSKGFVLRYMNKKYIEGCLRCTIPKKKLGEKFLVCIQEYKI